MSLVVYANKKWPEFRSLINHQDEITGNVVIHNHLRRVCSVTMIVPLQDTDNQFSAYDRH
jgi:hypothetical protein